MAMESLSINIARKTWEPSDDEACVVFKEWSTMAPAICGVAADIPGNGTPPSGGGGLKNQQHFRQCTGSWGVVYWSGAGFVRRRETASYYVCHPWCQLIQYSWREGDGLWPNWRCAVKGSRMVGAGHRGWVLVSRIRLHSYIPGLLSQLPRQKDCVHDLSALGAYWVCKRTLKKPPETTENNTLTVTV